MVENAVRNMFQFMLCVARRVQGRLPTLFSLALPTWRDCALGGKALGVLPLLPLPTVMSLSPVERASLWKQRDEIFMYVGRATLKFIEADFRTDGVKTESSSICEVLRKKKF